MPDIRAEICSFSQKTEQVLILLLQENEELRQMIQTEISQREKEGQDIREQFNRDLKVLSDKLENEEKLRETQTNQLQSQIDNLTKELSDATEKLESQISLEKQERSEESQKMNQFFGKENEERKKNLDEINNWIREENEKRMAEAEALRARMEREKQELRDYIERDNKAIKEKMSAEEAERQRKEKEMQDKLKEQQAQSENEIIQLYKKMAAENQDRIREIDDLNKRLAKEKEEIRDKLEKEKEDLRLKLETENERLQSLLDKSQKGLKTEIDENHYSNTNKINELAEKLAKLLKNASKDRDEIMSKLSSQNHSLRALIGQPLSVYFCAYRTEDYLDDGEDYLTFSGCHANLGSGLDPKSGIFQAPIAGAYLFVVHVCSADMHKALLSIRMNGYEVASFYDQNHESNHKNSMVGQSVVLELEVGDKVQVYMFTHTGLQDKRNNHLTQFVGLFLRPKGFLENNGEITNGLH